MKISFELEPDDIERFQEAMDRAERRIRHVIGAYDEFCAARSVLPDATDSDRRIAQARQLARRRDQLHARMRRRTIRAAVVDAAGPQAIQG